MKHNLKISVSKEPPTNNIVTVRRKSIRERLLTKLFGNSKKVTILVPGDSVDKVTISEVKDKNDGGSKDAD